ncbi:hypothetical protein AQUCO_05700153v1 [Aquilegia coerulea]|uniref:DYW domain-containing protein n=1 Tax=Aquilegia coerulea TaxID=218851 RepID=A0A2G5CG21_AQUCA|nr:hypothetical protein AQUCO_05700153v1 [Aquilegia coerulea]
MYVAYEVFAEKMAERNLTSWDIMIRGLTMNELAEDAIDLFTEFKRAGLKPDGQMFMGVFLACSFLCDVAEGMLHFDSMNKVYGIVPSMEHYLSIVNMLGSTGYLDEAMEFIEKMPFESNVDVWNTKLANHCNEIVNCLDPSRVTGESKDEGLVIGKAYDDKQKLKEEQYTKSLYDAKYFAGYTSHFDKAKIFSLLKVMSGQIKTAGYVPKIESVSFKIEEEEKEESLLVDVHEERIALAAGLLGTEPRSPVKIESLSFCEDCHNAIKIISKLVGREITSKLR